MSLNKEVCSLRKPSTPGSGLLALPHHLPVKDKDKARDKTRTAIPRTISEQGWTVGQEPGTSANSGPTSQLTAWNNGGRVYVMRKEEVEDALNVVMGSFSILSQPINVLFDSGATHSFVSIRLVETLELVPTRQSSLLFVILLEGKVCDV